MNKQETVQTLVQLLKDNGYKVTDQNDYGIEFQSRDKDHNARISGSGVSFEHPTEHALQYVYGFKHMPEIRAFLRNRPSFGPEALAAIQESSRMHEVHHRPSTLKRLEKQAEKKAKKGQSARSVIFEMLAEGKSVDEIAAKVHAMKPERPMANVKSQIYLHRSEYNRAQKKNG